MSREPLLFLEDIQARCIRILDIAQNNDFQHFVSDDTIHEAILRHLTIIGEAVKQLPGSITDTAPQIPWRRIAKLRDILIHIYFGIKDEIIWQIIQEDIPKLREHVAVILDGIREADS